jgi:membrane associated rhomboid family serine protease
VVIPIHDQNPVRRTPVVTYVLIALNVVIFIFWEPVSKGSISGGQTASQLCHQQAYFDKYAAIPKELISNKQLDHPEPTGPGFVDPAGGVHCLSTPHPPWHKQPWLSVLYSMFLHGGWLHLLGNMLFLYVFGNNVEDRFGRIRFTLFYLLCGYAAAYGFAAINPSSTTALVGASGAIAGVLGAYLVMFPRARVTSLVPFFFFIPLRLPAWMVLGSWFALQAVYSAGAGVASGADVAYVAHVVGFLVGAAITYSVGRGRRPRPPQPAQATYHPSW